MLDVATITDREAAAKLRRAMILLLGRTQLFGLTLLGPTLKIKEDPRNTQAMKTDGRSIWYSPTWVRKREESDVTFVLCHEEYHCFCNHPGRRGDRDPALWNRAADIRTNWDVLKILRVRGSWPLPEDAIPNYDWAEHLTVEEIYDILKQEQEQQGEDTQPHDPYTPDMEDPQETEQESDDFRRALTQDLVQAAMAEEQAHNGKHSLEDVYPKNVWERLQELKRCEVPWDVLLRGRLAAALGNDLVSWVPPNRRYLPDIALPSRRGTIENELLLGVDISGSITDDDLKRFRACILPAARRAKTTTVLTFDEEIREQYTTTKPDSILRNIRFRTASHSHTSVRGVFAEVDRRRPSAVAIITDGHILLPDRPYPHTHWILTPRGAALPWGHHYRLKTSW